jgi:hypothetical protein
MAVKDGAGWHAESVLDGLPPHPMFGARGGFERHDMRGGPGRMMRPGPQPTANG